MNTNRRNFLKLTGLTGVGLVGTRILPGYAAPNKNKETENLTEQIDEYIPAPEEQITPAPEWLQKADMITWAPWFTGSNDSATSNTIWKNYDMDFKDVWVEKRVRVAWANVLKKLHAQVSVVKDGEFNGSAIKGVPLISHVPVSETAFKQAHEQAFRIIPYVHFTDIHTFYADQDVFPMDHPEILLRNREGKWAHLPMDGTDRLNRLLICANNPTYCKLSLAYIKKLMDWGADGLFVDNVVNRAECFAPKFTKVSPEFGSYVHEHIYPDATHAEAFNHFLESVRALVKSYGDDKIVLLNSGIDTIYQKNGDCCMWESFIYSWSWEGRFPDHTWAYIKQRAQKNEWYTHSGRRITALSTINPLSKEAKNDAFWAFTAARLVGFIWWADLTDTKAEVLYKIQLGKPLDSLQEVNGLAYRQYENGLLVLNNTNEDVEQEIKLSVDLKTHQLFDVFNRSAKVTVKNKKVKIPMPKNSARIYTTYDLI